MHIMQILSGGGVNGSVKRTLYVSRYLAEQGHRVTLVCRPRAWVIGQLEHDPVEIVVSDQRRIPTGELRRVAALARETGVDVLHTHNSRAHFFGVLLRHITGIPCVATAHSRRLQLHWRFNDHVIAVSDAAARFQHRYNLVPWCRLETIHSFTFWRQFADVSAEQRAASRRELGVGENELLIGKIGLCTPKKGVHYAVRALPRIAARIPGARLAIVGPGDKAYIAKVRAEAEALGVAERIIWTGHRSDMPHVLAALDLYLTASLEEAGSTAILEGMAAGLPAVASDVGGLPEHAANGETALLAPPARPDAIADATIRLLGDPALRRKFGERARERVIAHFSPESQLPQIEAALTRHVRRRQAA